MRTPLRLVKGRRWAKRSNRIAEFGRALVAGSWQTCNSCALAGPSSVTEINPQLPVVALFFVIRSAFDQVGPTRQSRPQKLINCQMGFRTIFR